MAEYKLSEDDAKRLVAEKSVAEYFEEAVREKGSDAKKALYQLYSLPHF